MKTIDSGLPVLVAATAALTLPPIDMAFYGFAGAVIGASIMLMTLMSAPTLPTATQWIQFVVRAISAGIIGTLFAWIGGNGVMNLLFSLASFLNIAPAVPVDKVSFSHLIGLTLGFGTWRLLSAVLDRAVNEISNRGRTLS